MSLHISKAKLKPKQSPWWSFLLVKCFNARHSRKAERQSWYQMFPNLTLNSSVFRLWGFLVVQCEEPVCQCRRHRMDPWVGKIPWRRKWQPTPGFLPGKSHGQRSLVGYSPWYHKESDTTWQLNITSLGYGSCLHGEIPLGKPQNLAALLHNVHI